MAKLIDFRYENNLGLDKLAREHPVALARALNRVSASVRTEISRTVREQYNVKKQDLDPNIKTTNANPSQLASVVTIRARRMPIALFSARPTRRGVTFQVRRGRARVTIPRSFMYRGRYGERVMQREASVPRFPIAEWFTISVTEMAGSREIEKRIKAKIDERLPIEIDQQLTAISKGYASAKWGKR